jgi:hypothetical protein
MLCSSLYASCSSSGGDAESNVFISLVHVHTHIIKKKKKIVLVYEVRRHNEEALLCSPFNVTLFRDICMSL